MTFGADRLVRTGLAIGAAAMASALLVDQPWAVLTGIAVLGAGVALVYPCGMSAAAETQSRSAAGISAIQTIRYSAAFAAPTLIGLLSAGLGLRTTFLIALGLAAGVGLVLGFSFGRGAGLTNRPGSTPGHPQDHSQARATRHPA